ncbi:hypothetical protein JCM5350_005952 [Sporobolomyces pararoseus]
MLIRLTSADTSLGAYIKTITSNGSRRTNICFRSESSVSRVSETGIVLMRIREIVGRLKPQGVSWANLPQQHQEWWTDTLEFIDIELPRIGSFCFVRSQKQLHAFSKAVLADLTEKLTGLRDHSGRSKHYSSLESLPKLVAWSKRAPTPHEDTDTSHLAGQLGFIMVDVALFGISLAIATKQPLKSNDVEVVFRDQLAYIEAVGLREITLFVRQILASRWLSLTVKEQSLCMDELYICEREGWTTPSSFLQALEANANLVPGLPFVRLFFSLLTLNLD